MRKTFLFIALAFITNFCFSQTLGIAVYQYDDNPRIKNLESLANYLQQQLRITASVRSYPTVHALIKGMQNNEVDLAFISTFGYLLLQAGESKHPMTSVAALIAPNAEDNYKTAIVSNRNDSLLTLKDLKTHGASSHIAFVAKGSTSGNLVPRLLLNRTDIKDAEKHFASVQYAGTHARAIELLLSDSVDVAAMGSTEWDKLDSIKKAKLSLLHLSSEIPLGPVLLNKEIDNKLKKQMIQALQDFMKQINQPWKPLRQRGVKLNKLLISLPLPLTIIFLF